MTKKNHASLKISSGHYRTADLLIGVAFLLASIVGGYYAISQQLREYWLLLIVGIVGAILMLRRARTNETGE